MPLRLIAKDPETNGEHCPTVWVDKDKGEFVIQGWKADETTTAECLQAGPVPDTEGVVRLPVRMAQALQEACRVAEQSDVR
ncbi:hypothetical protein GCM10010252_28550 [Streptomyces aureoverticillatus]|nr:hypothetical protein GCM10010252_28550 [Streptomyces aureoverticillatus]